MTLSVALAEVLRNGDSKLLARLPALPDETVIDITPHSLEKIDQCLAPNREFDDVPRSILDVKDWNIVHVRAKGEPCAWHIDIASAPLLISVIGV